MALNHLHSSSDVTLLYITTSRLAQYIPSCINKIRPIRHNTYHPNTQQTSRPTQNIPFLLSQTSDSNPLTLSTVIYCKC
jgi:hypothetical protein